MRSRDGVPTAEHSGDRLEGTEGFLLIFREGDVPGRPLEKWPVEVGDIRRMGRRNGTQRWQETFAVPEKPSYDCLVPPAPTAAS